MQPFNENSASGSDRLDNFLAGQSLQKEKAGKRKTSKSFSFSGLWANGRKKSVAQNPIMPNVADYVMWDYYDRFTYAAGATVPTNFNFFTVPSGTSGKTKADTNLELVSQLPNPYFINVTHIGFYFDPNVLSIDIDALFNQSYFEFIVNNKTYAEGKLNRYPGGGGIYGVTTKTATSQLTNGTSMVGNMYDLRLPAGIQLGAGAQGAIVADGLTGVYILQQQNFKVSVNLPGGALALTAADATPNPGTGLVLSCYLYGVLSRSVS